MKQKVLLVEDDGDWLEIYCNYLRDEDYHLDTARSVNQALGFIEKTPYHAVITDLKMLGFGDDFGGFAVLQKTKELSPGTQVVIITAYGTQELAFRATQQGAYDYVVKPPETEKFKMCVRRAVQASLVKQKLADISNRLETDTRDKLRQVESIKIGSESIIGNSQSMQVVFEQMSKATQSLSPVLIWGESGTGKRLLAKAIHKNGRGFNRTFSQVSCNQLFRYEEAILKNLKKLKGGTIFLYDLGSIGEKDQIVLNRMVSVSEPLEIRLISSLITIEDQFDHIAAQNKILSELFSSLAQISIYIPPLRYRKEDIAALAGHFVNLHANEIEPTPQVSISPQAANLLIEHNYTISNVRELQDLLQQTVLLLGGDGTILPEHLPLLQKKSADQDQLTPTHLQKDSASLRHFLYRYFNETELKDLCFDLQIDYESLPGDNKQDRAREIVAYVNRHGRVIELVKLCYQLRPNVT